MDYKKSDIAGNKWHRFSQINISNPRVGTPSVTCTEQEVFSLSDSSEIIRDVGFMSFPFDPNKAFDILNPATGEKVGTSTGAQVYALVYSYTMAEAMRRDAAAAAAIIPVMPPPNPAPPPPPEPAAPPAQEPETAPNPYPLTPAPPPAGP